MKKTKEREGEKEEGKKRGRKEGKKADNAWMKFIYVAFLLPSHTPAILFLTC